jgi:hypothetical protein
MKNWFLPVYVIASIMNFYSDEQAIYYYEYRIYSVQAITIALDYPDTGTGIDESILSDIQS